MIGGTLIRFHPDSYYRSAQQFHLITHSGVKQKEDGLWKDIKTRAPTVLRDIVTEVATAGLKGLNSRGPGKAPNWKGALEGIKTRVKRKVQQELRRLVRNKKVRRDLFGE